MTTLYDVQHLTRQFRTGGRLVTALDDVSLTLEKGERLGIVGESGSGKSTLVRLMAALDRPTSGSIRFDGVPIEQLPESRLGFLRAQVQMVFQDPRGSLNPRMTVRRIITEPLRSRLLRRELAGIDPDTRVRELMDAVGLPAAMADRYPHEFSGGQRQRIAIARALAPRPSVLIADEPVSALDVSVRAQVLNLLMDLVGELGLSLLFVSHDLTVVRHVCDNAIVMRRGQIVERGPTADVFARPTQEYTRTLLESVPRFRT